MNQRAYNAVTATLLLIMALLHALRIVFGWAAEIGGLGIPVWASGLALVVTGALAYFGFRHNV